MMKQGERNVMMKWGRKECNDETEGWRNVTMKQGERNVMMKWGQKECNDETEGGKNAVI